MAPVYGPTNCTQRNEFSGLLGAIARKIRGSVPRMPS